MKKKQEKATKRVERLEAELHKSRLHEVDTQVLNHEMEDPRFSKVAAEATRQARRRVKEAEQRHQKAVKEQQHQESMPREILERDTTRENVATCLTLSMLMLVEWVMREYMGGGFRMELQTFLNYFLYLPVEARISWHKVRYRIDANDLSEAYVELLDQACTEINRRKIKRDDRRLVFEVFRGPDENQ